MAFCGMKKHPLSLACRWDPDLASWALDGAIGLGDGTATAGTHGQAL